MRRAMGRGAVAAMSAVTLLLVLHALFLSQLEHFRVVDDAYVTFRYVANLVNGQGLVFNPGERVEGYSNFLWLILLVPFHLLNIDLVRASQLLGMAAAIGTLLLTRLLAERFTGATWLGICASILLACDGSFARWAVDGLETPLFALLVTCIVWSEIDEKRRLRGRNGPSRVGILLALAAMTRPEGLLLFGLLSLYRVLAGLRATLGWGAAPGPLGRTLEDQNAPLGDPTFWRELFGLWGWFALLYGPYFAWRVHYYGDWMPNTAYAKLAPGLVSTVRGIQYCAGFLEQRAAWGAGLLGAWLVGRYLGGATGRRAPESRPLLRSTWPLRLPLGLCLGMAGYVVLVGGDWMNRGRFFTPVMPLIALMVAEGTARALGGSRVGAGYPRDPRAAGLLLTMAVLGGLGSSWLGERPWLADAGANHLEREAVTAWLKANAPAGSSLLTEEVGEIPFYTGLVTYDVYGLTDRHIAHFGQFDPDSPPGHQRADLNYSLSLKPDFLVMAGFAGTWQRNVAAGDKARYPALQAYEPVSLKLPVGRLEIYRRRKLP